MDNEELEELLESANSVADYFSGITGSNILVGADATGDVWISSTRTNGREYLESIQEAERRLELLYSDYFDDDDTDPYGGLI